ncbi:hypothetical protein ACHAWO_013979 [Cyclotella atomus]|uniref:Uncharacterized protein n=1 Tax=Cyclotella atomus TaxID=382360 RepID=A0ABD3MSH5_9STRA
MNGNTQDSGDNSKTGRSGKHALSSLKYRERKAKKEKLLVDAFNAKVASKLGTPPVSLIRKHTYSMRGKPRPKYGPPPEEMKGMSKQEVSAWKEKERKKRKAATMRLNRLEHKQLLERLSAQLSQESEKTLPEEKSQSRSEQKEPIETAPLPGGEDYEATAPEVERKSRATVPNDICHHQDFQVVSMLEEASIIHASPTDKAQTGYNTAVSFIDNQGHETVSIPANVFPSQFHQVVGNHTHVGSKTVDNVGAITTAAEDDAVAINYDNTNYAHASGLGAHSAANNICAANCLPGFVFGLGSSTTSGTINCITGESGIIQGDVMRDAQEISVTPSSKSAYQCFDEADDMNIDNVSVIEYLSAEDAFQSDSSFLGMSAEEEFNATYESSATDGDVNSEPFEFGTFEDFMNSIDDGGRFEDELSCEL